jgi:hypothetical protein
VSVRTRSISSLRKSLGPTSPQPKPIKPLSAARMQSNTMRVSRRIFFRRRRPPRASSIAAACIGLAKHVLGCSGEDVEGHIREALRLSPRDTRAFSWYMVVGMAKLMTNADQQEVLDWLRRSIEANPNHALAHFHFAGALAMAGDIRQARSSAGTGLALDPSFTIRRHRTNVWDNPGWRANREGLYEGMRMAGVPEG